MTAMVRHAIEAKKSWETHLQHQQRHHRRQATIEDDGDEQLTSTSTSDSAHRTLRHHHHDGLPTLSQIEQEREIKYQEEQQRLAAKARAKAHKKHEKNLKDLFRNPGIQDYTQHGFMIDAGSTGSRLHLYEWEPRVLRSSGDVKDAVAGQKLSFPGTESRWTDRLRPGIAEFASLSDEELKPAIAKYLQPMLDFAQTVLREKEENFDTYPIYLRATAGMRTLTKADRKRVLGTVRDLFNNNTYCPFYFEDEYARVLSGEEEAIFGWTGINFVMGNLIEETEGAGTVISPRLTYGALDMGGASTQISFYEPNEDIMSNLIKLQIGQAKHWNLYAHSFLYYGMNEARNRMHAYLLEGKSQSQRLKDGVHNPCLPGGSKKDVRLGIHIDSYGRETWNFTNSSAYETDGSYNAVLINDKETGDFEECMKHVNSILHLESNQWCNFAHRGECAVNSVYMPELPKQSNFFGEFLAFSNYYHIWDFLGLPERASIGELLNATQTICSMSKKDIFEFNKENGNADEDDVEDFCFRSAYAFQLLHNGYGFDLDEYIVATDVLQGQKVGWALGAMLYELNTMPWTYLPSGRHHLDEVDDFNQSHPAFFVVLLSLFGLIAVSMIAMFRARDRRNKKYHCHSVGDGETMPLKSTLQQ